MHSTDFDAPALDTTAYALISLADLLLIPFSESGSIAILLFAHTAGPA